MDNTYDAYKWLDAQDMKPKHSNDPQEVVSKVLMSKMLDFLDMT